MKTTNFAYVKAQSKTKVKRQYPSWTHIIIDSIDYNGKITWKVTYKI